MSHLANAARIKSPWPATFNLVTPLFAPGYLTVSTHFLRHLPPYLVKGWIYEPDKRARPI